MHDMIQPRHVSRHGCYLGMTYSVALLTARADAMHLHFDLCLSHTRCSLHTLCISQALNSTHMFIRPALQYMHQYEDPAGTECHGHVTLPSLGPK